MTAPNAPKPNQGASTPVPPKARSGLARTSFVLALIPLFAVALMVSLFVTTFFLAGAIPMFNHATGIVVLALYPGCLCASLCAIVTAGLALSRAHQQPLQQAGQGFAWAGLVIGIVGCVIGFLSFFPLLFIASTLLCSPGCGPGGG